MTRKRLAVLAAAVVLAITVAVQTVWSAQQRAALFMAQADVPTVAHGVDVLAGMAQIPARTRGFDYHRAAFGDAWSDDTSAPGGHNGCDTRNDILERDLVDKTYTSISRCPHAVATGTLHDPYSNAVVAFTRGNQTGASVQIDHIVPLALAWDLGARDWPAALRLRFANDPANLLAVEGQANQDKGDSEPALWMPPNVAFRCQYAMQFIAVLRGYGLPVDAPSASALRGAASTCPMSAA
ncbi:HNH endonuclease [Mycolicibacterium moriokaense]|nr:HNH endonuclease [Mycolicibacterium moriokaense]